jgi:hypothetical protein
MNTEVPINNAGFRIIAHPTSPDMMTGPRKIRFFNISCVERMINLPDECPRAIQRLAVILSIAEREVRHRISKTILGIFRKGYPVRVARGHLNRRANMQ